MKIKTKIIYVLATAALIFSLSGCKIVRSVGETLGIVEEKTEQVEPPAPNSSKPNNSQEPNTASKVNYGALLIWLSLVAGVLVAGRFWLKSREEDEEVKPKRRKK